ncbi:MAG: universal stress protein [Solirubrobacteraceae bacterium]
MAIRQVNEEFADGRDAVVVTVWQPGAVGFHPANGHHFDASQATEVHKAAEGTAAHGASLAKRAGFEVCALTVEASPTWKGIIEAAEEVNASLIVIGSHRHGGVTGRIGGSVAAAVVLHAPTPVLIVRQPE